MDRETAERLAKLEMRMADVQEERRVWNTLIRDAIAKTITWLLAVGVGGILFGWHLPADVRKWFAEWLSR